MCKSRAQGGQRCAAHTRPAYQAAAPGSPEWEKAAVEYASTPEGKKVVTAAGDAAAADGNFDLSAACTTAVRAGLALRASNLETATIIKGANDWEPGTVHPVGAYDQVQRDEFGDTFYTRDGKLNRLDGAAIVEADGTEEFWRDGEAFCEYACMKGQNPPSYCTRYDG